MIKCIIWQRHWSSSTLSAGFRPSQPSPKRHSSLQKALSCYKVTERKYRKNIKWHTSSRKTKIKKEESEEEFQVISREGKQMRATQEENTSLWDQWEKIPGRGSQWPRARLFQAHREKSKCHPRTKCPAQVYNQAHLQHSVKRSVRIVKRGRWTGGQGDEGAMGHLWGYLTLLSLKLEHWMS